LVPLTDLRSGLYLGLYQGGLYPGGANIPPFAHHIAGVMRAHAVEPLNTDGEPSAAGKYVLLSIGMSNTTQEFCSGTVQGVCRPWTFGGQAAASVAVNHDELTIVDGARGGQTASTWDSPSDANYDRIRDEVLAPRGLSEAQVQAVWVKVANAAPTVSLPDPGADALLLVEQMGDIARALRVRYPNVKVAFLSSRIYAGYASTGLNPEPYAYESGLAVKWVIAAQIEQMAGGGVDARAGDLDSETVAPWLAWGPYLWADGLTPRGDGLIWECANLDTDGTHPSESGELGRAATSMGAAEWWTSTTSRRLRRASACRRFRRRCAHART
jgi:hypothetical protein